MLLAGPGRDASAALSQLLRAPFHTRNTAEHPAGAAEKVPPKPDLPAAFHPERSQLSTGLKAEGSAADGTAGTRTSQHLKPAAQWDFATCSAPHSSQCTFREMKSNIGPTSKNLASGGWEWVRKIRPKLTLEGMKAFLLPALGEKHAVLPHQSGYQWISSSSSRCSFG